MSTKRTLLALTLLAPTLACSAAPGSADGTAVTDQDEALSLRSSKSIKTLLDGIAIENEHGTWQPPVSGTLLHSCRTSGIRGRVTFDVYVADDTSKPNVVVIKAK